MQENHEMNHLFWCIYMFLELCVKFWNTRLQASLRNDVANVPDSIDVCCGEEMLFDGPLFSWCQHHRLTSEMLNTGSYMALGTL